MGLRVRIAATALAVTASAALLATSAIDGSSAALAHEDRGTTATGDGATPLFTFKFHVHRDSDGRPSGYFTAAGVGPTGALIAPQGPVTCVEFDGNKVGFLYPLEDKTRPALLRGSGTAIMITAQDNGDGHLDTMGFLGPLPTSAFPGCKPTLTTMPVTSGNIDIH
jgi:hypothetical protein